MDVILGSPTDGQFVLSDSKRGDDGELWSVIASIEVEGLQASEKINAHYATRMDDLIHYFDDLAAHWQLEKWRFLPGHMCDCAGQELCADDPERA